MAREFRFPFFGHGSTDSGRLWIVFREPIGAAWKVLDAGAPDAISLGEPVDRVVEIDTEGLTTTKQAKEVDAWLASAHAAQPIAFAAFADETDGDAWHDWSRKRIGKDILPWLVETWRSAPAFASTLASRAQAQVLGQYSTKKPEAIAQIVDALQAALGLDAGADSQLARQVGWLIHRLPEPGPIVASLSPRLRVLVWAGNEIAPASLDAVLAALAELGDAAKPLGHDVNRIAARWGWTALHERALELDGAPVGSFLAIAKAKPDALDELIRRHFDRFVADSLDFLLQNGVMHELDGLVDHCIVAAAERADVEAAGFVANALYKQTGANRAHVSVRMARDYVARFARCAATG